MQRKIESIKFAFGISEGNEANAKKMGDWWVKGEEIAIWRAEKMPRIERKPIIILMRSIFINFDLLL